MLLYFKLRDLLLDESSTEAILTEFTEKGILCKGKDAVKIVPGIRVRF